MTVRNPYRHLMSGKLTRENYYKRLPHRCIKCNARRTLDRRWSLYMRPPKCLTCGYYRLRPCFDRLAAAHGRKKACNCGGYHFRHRRGSKHCEHNQRAEQHYVERSEARAR